jgi:hypothetical protein
MFRVPDRGCFNSPQQSPIGRALTVPNRGLFFHQTPDLYLASPTHPMASVSDYAGPFETAQTRQHHLTIETRHRGDRGNGWEGCPSQPISMSGEDKENMVIRRPRWALVKRPSQSRDMHSCAPAAHASTLAVQRADCRENHALGPIYSRIL